MMAAYKLVVAYVKNTLPLTNPETSFAVIVANNSTILLAKVIIDALFIRLVECSLTDLTQFSAKVTMMSNILGVFSTLFFIVYLKITCSNLGCHTAPRTFHSNRYQIVPYRNNKAFNESTRSYK